MQSLMNATAAAAKVYARTAKEPEKDNGRRIIDEPFDGKIPLNGSF